MRRRLVLVTGVVLAGCATLAASASVYAQQSAPHPRSAATIDPNIHKIKHVIVIMQENRSFDSYFGTFPGADGIPTGVCVPDPRNGGCRKPWVDHHDSNGNDPHAETPFSADINGGKMDGFVSIAEKMLCKPKPAPLPPDVMGYHVAVGHPELLGLRARTSCCRTTSSRHPGRGACPRTCTRCPAWSAKCTKTGDPMSCKSTDMPPERLPNRQTPFAWTDVTWLLHRHHVSWSYYLDHGAVTWTCTTRAGCRSTGTRCPASPTCTRTTSWAACARSSVFYKQAKAGHAAEGVLGRAGLQGQRARPGPGQHRAGVRHQGHQRGHARPGLVSPPRSS